jgi:hypothetical protein
VVKFAQNLTKINKISLQLKSNLILFWTSLDLNPDVPVLDIHSNPNWVRIRIEIFTWIRCAQSETLPTWRNVTYRHRTERTLNDQPVLWHSPGRYKIPNFRSKYKDDEKFFPYRYVSRKTDNAENTEIKLATTVPSEDGSRECKPLSTTRSGSLVPKQEETTANSYTLILLRVEMKLNQPDNYVG